MVTTEEIDARSITEVKRDFYDLMNKVITMYGDDQEDTSEQSEQMIASLYSTGADQVESWL